MASLPIKLIRWFNQYNNELHLMYASRARAVLWIAIETNIVYPQTCEYDFFWSKVNAWTLDFLYHKANTTHTCALLPQTMNVRTHIIRSLIKLQLWRSIRSFIAMKLTGQFMYTSFTFQWLDQITNIPEQIGMYAFHKEMFPFVAFGLWQAVFWDEKQNMFLFKIVPN